MADLNVNRQYLLKLAAEQDAAADQAEKAADTTSDTAGSVKKTHGKYSASSNKEIASAASKRQAAGLALSQASSDLAIALRTALAAYSKTDDDWGQTLDAEMRDS